MRPHARRGTALVEFALVVPIFCALIAAIIDLGVLVNHQLVLTSAAREGARAAALGQTADQVTSAVTQYLQNAGFNPMPAAGGIAVAFTSDAATVKLATPVPFLFDSSGPPITLQATVTMRRE